jgi:hypothetical protein
MADAQCSGERRHYDMIQIKLADRRDWTPIIHKQEFLGLCRKQISVDMTAPTSGVRGIGVRSEPGLSRDENRLRFYKKFDFNNMKDL